ncbi:hypothetical protein MY5147_009620 [Beauveria neobassiana]
MSPPRLHCRATRSWPCRALRLASSSTYIAPDGCNGDSAQLGTDQGADSLKPSAPDMQRSWPSTTTALRGPMWVRFCDAAGDMVKYNYTIAESPVHRKNVVDSVVRTPPTMTLIHYLESSPAQAFGALGALGPVVRLLSSPVVLNERHYPASPYECAGER